MWQERKVYNDIKPESFEAYVQAVRQAPYGAAMDAHSFWLRMQDDSFANEVKANEDGANGLALIATIIYAFTYRAEMFLRSLPVLGLFVALFSFMFVHLPRTFGLLDHAFWCLTGRSSPVISSLMPRDPYTYVKRAVICVTDFLPLWLGVPIGMLARNLRPLAVWLEAMAKLAVAAHTHRFEGGHGSTGKDVNEWSAYVPEILDHAARGGVVVDAPVATGKSTFLPGAIFAARSRYPYSRFVHLVPRKILRDTTSLPYGIKSQAVKAGVDVHGEYLFMTYGHALQRLHELDEDGTLWLFDEFHEQTGEMILLLHKLAARPKVLLSATANQVKGFTFHVVKPEVKGLGYKREIFETPGNAMSMFMRAQKEWPELAKRALIIVPTLREVDELKAGLEFQKVPVSELSSRSRTCAPAGVVIATQMVDAGYDMKPPALMVIDSGRQLVVDRGVMKVQASSPSVAKQRAGRCGRLTDGVVLRPPTAATGAEPTTYPAVTRLCEPILADHYGLPRLKEVPGARPKAPFYRCFGSISAELVWLLHLQGYRGHKWRAAYDTIRTTGVFDEDDEYIRAVLPAGLVVGSWQAAYAEFCQGVIQVDFDGPRTVTWLEAKRGRWYTAVETDEVKPLPLMATDDTAPKLLEDANNILDRMKKAIDNGKGSRDTNKIRRLGGSLTSTLAQLSTACLRLSDPATHSVIMVSA